jgi:hypothetical protein
MRTTALSRMAAWLCLVGLLAGCTGGATGGRRAQQDRNLIDADEIAGTQHSNAYTLVQALRPHWLEVRAAGGRMVKRVYLGDMYVGGAETLRQFSAATIGSIQYYDGPAATQRWGTDHAAGVIQVWTRSQ